MEARKHGRGERQKVALRTVARQVAGLETPQRLSEGQFDFNAMRMSAQSVDEGEKHENGTHRWLKS